MLFRSLKELMLDLATQAAVFEALLLIASSIHKAATWPRARAATERFAGVPAPWTTVALIAAMAGEALAALLLAMPAYRMLGGLAAGAIFALYLALMLRAIAQGRRDVDCGCSFGSARHSLGAFQVIRNCVLLGGALWVAVLAKSGGPTAAGATIQGSQVLAALALLALYSAFDQIMALQPLRSGEVL